MMKISHTTQYAIGSFLFFVFGVAVAGFTYYLINTDGARLADRMQVIGENQLMQERYDELQVILSQSEDEHAELDSHLLTEGKTINFLSEIETLARNMGLQFSTDSLEVETMPNPQFGSIVMRLQAEGERATLIEFLTLLETLPYYSRIQELQFDRVQARSGTLWSARITLMVAMHTNTETDS